MKASASTRRLNTRQQPRPRTAGTAKVWELRKELIKTKRHDDRQTERLKKLDERFSAETTEHQEAEEKLRHTEQLLKDTQRITRLGTWEWDVPANKVTWSDELYRIFGLRRNNFKATYEAYLERVHPQDRPQVKAGIEEALRERKSFSSEHRIARPDGSVRVLQTQGEVMTDKQNRPVRMLGCCQDITERTQTEQRLAESLSLHNATLESTADGILVVDLEGRLVTYNCKFVDMWQIPAPLMESYKDERALKVALEQLKDPETFLTRVRHLYDHPALESFDVVDFKDGRVFERFSQPQRIGEKIIGRVWSFRDVTHRSRTLEALRRSEERYRSLVSATTQVVWTTNSDGEIVEDNPSWREFTGQTQNEIVGSGWLEAVHPDDRERTAEIWANAVAMRSIYETEYRLHRADGEWRDMSVRGVPVLESDGRIREWVGFCHDITDSKNAEKIITRERNFSDLLINSLPGIFYLLDENGLNLRWNKNLEAVTEYSAEEIAQMRGTDFVADEEKQLIAERIAKVFSTGYAEVEITMISKSGKRIPYYCTGTLIHLDGKPRLVGMGIDISKLKQAREEIKKLNRGLGRRVRERTAQLKAINKELESFSYSVSHDLRAPLRAIGGFALLLKEDHRDQLNEEALLLVEKISQAGERMSRLIDDLLNYSRIGRSAINLRPIALNDLLRQISGDFTQRIKIIGGKLSMGNLPTVIGDPTLLGQAFANLFENAINYRKRDVPLQLAVSSRNEPGGPVICVSDNGIGIAPVYHERIFDVFQRLHTSREYPGTGIGLANVKKSVEILGGKIWVESEENKGSTFCIKLKPAEPPPENG